MNRRTAYKGIANFYKGIANFIAVGVFVVLLCGAATAQDNSASEEAQEQLMALLSDLLPPGKTIANAASNEIMVAMYELIRSDEAKTIVEAAVERGESIEAATQLLADAVAAVVEEMPSATQNAAKAGMISGITDMVEAGELSPAAATSILVESRKIGMPGGYSVSVPQFVPDPVTGKISLQSGT